MLCGELGEKGVGFMDASKVVQFDEKWEAAENRQIKLFLFSLFIVIDL